MAAEDVQGRITIEGECWRWKGKDFLGFGGGDLLYGCARGPVGRGVGMRKCLQNDWCVNPWHWQAVYTQVKDAWKCRWGHELSDHGTCKQCERIKKAKWRAKKKLEEK